MPGQTLADPLVQIDTKPPQRARAKRDFVRRIPDRHQRLRWTVQAAFAALNVWIGIEFYLWVRYYETGGVSAYVPRPPGVEGWLPIASLMNLKLWLATGDVPAIHPAGMFLLIAFVLISFLLRKAFCGWLCPVGSLSELLWRTGQRIFGRNYALPRWADIALRSLKYVLLGLFLYAVGSMSTAAIHAFLSGPYGLISDVKMLNFFRFLSVTGAVVIGALAILSIFVRNFWCRYLCPYGALVGLASLLSPLRIRREASACIDCAKCAKVCPSLLPVDRLVTVRSAECTGCMACVSICPAKGALDMALPSRRRVPAWGVAAAMAVIFFAVVGYAQWSGHWQTDIPTEVYHHLVPRAQQFSHP